MIDTLMAFWNQDRRKRAMQLMLIFFLMCISISLLFTATSLPQRSHIRQQRSTTGRTGKTGGIGGTGTETPTVIAQIPQSPTVIPTSTMSVPRQFSPTPSSSPSPCSSPQAQSHGNIPSNRNAAIQQATAHTLTSQAPIVYDKPRQLQGGGPINTGTPISASPVPMPPTPTPTAGTQHIGGGWTSACGSNDIGAVAGTDILSFLYQNIWQILGISLVCTVLFYTVVKKLT